MLWLSWPSCCASQALRLPLSRLEQGGAQRMGLEARRQGLELARQLFLLLQELLLLGDQAADFTAQFGELFLEAIDGLLRTGFFVFIMAREAVQQGFGLVIRMLDAAAHRAGLLILQLPTQLFDTGTARQALAFQQLLGHAQGLLGHRQLGLGLQAGLVQLLALLLGGGLLAGQFLLLLVQLLLAVPEPRQLLEGPLLLAIVLEQAVEQLDLLGHGLGFGAGLLRQQVQAVRCWVHCSLARLARSSSCGSSAWPLFRRLPISISCCRRSR